MQAPIFSTIEDTVVHIPSVESLQAVFSAGCTAYGVQQQVIHVVRLQVFERALEHGYRFLMRPYGSGEIR